MKSQEEIREYILDVASLYSISDAVISIIHKDEENGMSWDETLETISPLIGLSREAILTCDQDASNILYKRYPYFDMISCWKFSLEMRDPGKFDTLIKYLFTFDKQEDQDYYPENRIEKAIKYSVLRRCEQKIKDINRMFPGTFPHTLPISTFYFETDYFFDYPNVYSLIYERNRVIKRFSTLFFEALNRELIPEEISEFNLYCLHFNAQDILCPSAYITYSYISNNRALFLSEGFSRMEDYLSLKREFCPWRAREFYTDAQYVKEYIQQNPSAKREIREFIKNVSAYSCHYIYIKNQDVLNNISHDLDFENSDYDLLENDADDSYSSPYEFSDEIYIEKTAKELGKDKELIDRIQKMVISSKFGGVETASDCQSAFSERIPRMIARFERGWVRG